MSVWSRSTLGTRLSDSIIKLLHTFAHALKMQEAGQTYIARPLHICLQWKKIFIASHSRTYLGLTLKISCLKMKQFIVLAFLFSNLIGQLTGDDGAFHVLHFHGKCVGGNSTVVLKEFCRKKYRWKGGVRLFDLSNDECIAPKDNTAVAGTLLKMTLQCSGTDSLFRFDERTNSIRHLISGWWISFLVNIHIRLWEPYLHTSVREDYI